MSAEPDPAFEAFKRAVGLAKGQSRLAEICGCTQSNISQLLRLRSHLPGRFVLKTEAATGVPRHDLRPDLYPREAPSIPSTSDTVAFDPTAKKKEGDA